MRHDRQSAKRPIEAPTYELREREKSKRRRRLAMKRRHHGR